MAIFVLLIVAPAAAEVSVYQLSGDQSTHFPTDGTLLRPNVLSGTARIGESGAAPVLEDLSIHVEFSESLGGEDVALEWTWIRDLGPAPGQSGSGSTHTSISWGTLTGWAQTGIVVCPSQCFFGDCDTACLNFLGYAGTGVPFPLKGSELDPGSWSFAGDGSAFSGEGFEVGFLAGGLSTEHIAPRGSRTARIPLAPLAAIAALGAGLVALVARRVPTRRS